MWSVLHGWFIFLPFVRTLRLAIFVKKIDKDCSTINLENGFGLTNECDWAVDEQGVELVGSRLQMNDLVGLGRVYPALQPAAIGHFEIFSFKLSSVKYFTFRIEQLRLIESIRIDTDRAIKCLSIIVSRTFVMK